MFNKHNYTIKYKINNTLITYKMYIPHLWNWVQACIYIPVHYEYNVSSFNSVD